VKRSAKALLIIVVMALIPAIVKLQTAIDPQRRQFQPGRGVSAVVTQVGNNPVVLPSQFVVGTIIGFREVVAGLLWVRANDFFHRGNYDAIVPLTRIITWLDPHQIDVYSTGAWHLAYNFVDHRHRADRRYLLPAIRFLDEGIENNPSVWDLYFDQGFTMYYLKVYDYNKAAMWLKLAQEKGAPYARYTQVAHAYAKAARLDDAIRQWKSCIATAQAALKKDPKNADARHLLQVSERNLPMLLYRIEMRKDLAKHPRDVNFEAGFERIGPKKFRISGSADLPDTARIDVTLIDSDYKEPELDKFTWEVDPNLTMVVDVGIHGLMVKDGKFDRIYNLSRDPKQYPLAADPYTLTISFDPQKAFHDVQDVTGWRGEGITDKRYLDTSSKGFRTIRKVIPLKREDII